MQRKLLLEFELANSVHSSQLYNINLVGRSQVDVSKFQRNNIQRHSDAFRFKINLQIRHRQYTGVEL